MCTVLNSIVTQASVSAIHGSCTYGSDRHHLIREAPKLNRYDQASLPPYSSFVWISFENKNVCFWWSSTTTPTYIHPLLRTPEQFKWNGMESKRNWIIWEWGWYILWPTYITYIHNSLALCSTDNEQLILIITNWCRYYHVAEDIMQLLMLFCKYTSVYSTKNGLGFLGSRQSENPLELVKECGWNMICLVE